MNDLIVTWYVMSLFKFKFDLFVAVFSFNFIYQILNLTNSFKLDCKRASFSNFDYFFM